MGSQRVGYDWATELNWTEPHILMCRWEGDTHSAKAVLSQSISLEIYDSYTFLYISLAEVVVVVQLLSHVWVFVTPMDYIALQAPLFFTISQSLLRFMSIVSVMPSYHLILCHPFLLLPSVFPSSESALCIRWPNYWSFSFSTHPSNEYSGLISFRTDWFDPLASKGLSRVL